MATVDAMLARLEGVRATAGDGWQARCPAHEDRAPSLSISTGEDDRVLVHCHAGCSPESVVGALGLTMRDLMPEAQPKVSRRLQATYPYTDEHGALLFEVLRYTPKDFRQRRPDGKGGHVWKLDGVRRVVYRLHELHALRPPAVFIVEGERDVHSLIAADDTLSATCNPGGAGKGKWTADYARQLVACGVQRVCVIADADAVGREHAEGVAASCAAAGIEARILDLSVYWPVFVNGRPTVPATPQSLTPEQVSELTGADVTDWLENGGTVTDLKRLAKAAPVWTGATAPEPPSGSAGPLTSLRDLLAQGDAAIDWLVQDRFAYGSVNLLAGRPKAGKSTLARALALAVARGLPWLGSRCRHGAVWYVALEDKPSEIRRHFSRMGATGTEPISFLIGAAPSTLLADLTKWIAAGDRPDLLIIDTAQRLFCLKDANDYALVTAAFVPVLDLARSHNVCVVLLHHAGKGTRTGIESVLGSTAWTGSVDNIMLLSRTDRYRLVSTVQRIASGPDLEDTIVLMDEATGDVRLGGTRRIADVAAMAAEMFTRVDEAGEITRAELLEAVEGRTQLKKQALAVLAADPRIIRTGTGKTNSPHVYRVARGNQSPSAPRGVGMGSRVPSDSREPDPLSAIPSITTGVGMGSRESEGSLEEAGDVEIF